MFKPIERFSHTQKKTFDSRHRFEHWYVDNQVYFITSRCRGRFPAFATEQAKAIFWDRFAHYAQEAGFVPWITSLMDNHYHSLGYIREGGRLKKMMQRFHGSVAKLVNDVLEADAACHAKLAPLKRGGAYRLVPFWKDRSGHDYFDGCIRSVKQCRLAYRYTLVQSVRHGVASDYRVYPHTRVSVDLERGVKRAVELGAFLEGVKYARYMRDRGNSPR